MTTEVFQVYGQDNYRLEVSIFDKYFQLHIIDLRARFPKSHNFYYSDEKEINELIQLRDFINGKEKAFSIYCQSYCSQLSDRKIITFELLTSTPTGGKYESFTFDRNEILIVTALIDHIVSKRMQANESLFDDRSNP